MDIRVSDYIAGKFAEIRQRVPIKLNGFFEADPETVATTTFEEQLNASGASSSEEDSVLAASENSGSVGTVIFPNIIPWSPESELTSVSAQENGNKDTESSLATDTSVGSTEADLAADGFSDGQEWETASGLDEGQWDGTEYGSDGHISGEMDSDISASQWEDDIYSGGTVEFMGETPPDGELGYLASNEFDAEGGSELDGVTDPKFLLTGDEALKLEQNIEYLNKYGDAEVRQMIEDAIFDASAKYGIDENLIRAVITQESGYSPTSLSSVGAQGLMQLMPETAESLGVNNPWDIGQNIDGGVRLLRDYLEDYEGDLRLVLSAYNAGPGTVERYQDVPPYKETEQYVKKVIGYYNQLSGKSETVN